MTPRFLDLVEVLEIHKSRIELYGGSPGVHDLGLLQSALAQPSAGKRACGHNKNFKVGT